MDWLSDEYLQQLRDEQERYRQQSPDDWRKAADPMSVARIENSLRIGGMQRSGDVAGIQAFEMSFARIHGGDNAGKKTPAWAGQYISDEYLQQLLDEMEMYKRTYGAEWEQHVDPMVRDRINTGVKMWKHQRTRPVEGGDEDEREYINDDEPMRQHVEAAEYTPAPPPPPKDSLKEYKDYYDPLTEAGRLAYQAAYAAKIGEGRSHAIAWAELAAYGVDRSLVGEDSFSASHYTHLSESYNILWTTPGNMGDMDAAADPAEVSQLNPLVEGAKQFFGGVVDFVQQCQIQAARQAMRGGTAMTVQYTPGETTSEDLPLYWSENPDWHILTVVDKETGAFVDINLITGEEERRYFISRSEDDFYGAALGEPYNQDQVLKILDAYDYMPPKPGLDPLYQPKYGLDLVHRSADYDDYVDTMMRLGETFANTPPEERTQAQKNAARVFAYGVHALNTYEGAPEDFKILVNSPFENYYYKADTLLENPYAFNEPTWRVPPRCDDCDPFEGFDWIMIGQDNHTPWAAQAWLQGLGLGEIPAGVQELLETNVTSFIDPEGNRVNYAFENIFEASGTNIGFHILETVGLEDIETFEDEIFGSGMRAFDWWNDWWNEEMFAVDWSPGSWETNFWWAAYREHHHLRYDVLENVDANLLPYYVTEINMLANSGMSSEEAYEAYVAISNRYLAMTEYAYAQHERLESGEDNSYGIVEALILSHLTDEQRSEYYRKREELGAWGSDGALGLDLAWYEISGPLRSRDYDPDEIQEKKVELILAEANLINDAANQALANMEYNGVDLPEYAQYIAGFEGVGEGTNQIPPELAVLLFSPQVIQHYKHEDRDRLTNLGINAAVAIAGNVVGGYLPARLMWGLFALSMAKGGIDAWQGNIDEGFGTAAGAVLGRWGGELLQEVLEEFLPGGSFWGGVPGFEFEPKGNPNLEFEPEGNSNLGLGPEFNPSNLSSATHDGPFFPTGDTTLDSLQAFNQRFLPAPETRPLLSAPETRPVLPAQIEEYNLNVTRGWEDGTLSRAEAYTITWEWSDGQWVLTKVPAYSADNFFGQFNIGETVDDPNLGNAGGNTFNNISGDASSGGDDFDTLPIHNEDYTTHRPSPENLNVQGFGIFVPTHDIPTGEIYDLSKEGYVFKVVKRMLPSWLPEGESSIPIQRYLDYLASKYPDFNTDKIWGGDGAINAEYISHLLNIDLEAGIDAKVTCNSCAAIDVLEVLRILKTSDEALSGEQIYQGLQNIDDFLRAVRNGPGLTARGMELEEGAEYLQRQGVAATVLPELPDDLWSHIGESDSLFIAGHWWLDADGKKQTHGTVVLGTTMHEFSRDEFMLEDGTLFPGGLLEAYIVFDSNIGEVVIVPRQFFEENLSKLAEIPIGDSRSEP